MINIELAQIKGKETWSIKSYKEYPESSRLAIETTVQWLTIANF